jgi:hypothetical protein
MLEKVKDVCGLPGDGMSQMIQNLHDTIEALQKFVDEEALKTELNRNTETL